MTEMEFLLKFIAVGVKVLAARLALFVTLILTFILFAWTMYSPDYWRLGAATIFSLLVFLPVIALDKKEKGIDVKTGGSDGNTT